MENELVKKAVKKRTKKQKTKIRDRIQRNDPNADFSGMAEMALSNLKKGMSRTYFVRVTVARYNKDRLKWWADKHEVAVCFVVNELIRAWLELEDGKPYFPKRMTKEMGHGTRSALSVNIDYVLYRMFWGRARRNKVLVSRVIDDLVGAFLVRVGGYE